MKQCLTLVAELPEIQVEAATGLGNLEEALERWENQLKMLYDSRIAKLRPWLEESASLWLLLGIPIDLCKRMMSLVAIQSLSSRNMEYSIVYACLSEEWEMADYLLAQTDFLTLAPGKPEHHAFFPPDYLFPPDENIDTEAKALFKLRHALHLNQLGEAKKGAYLYASFIDDNFGHHYKRDYQYGDVPCFEPDASMVLAWCAHRGVDISDIIQAFPATFRPLSGSRQREAFFKEVKRFFS